MQRKKTLKTNTNSQKCKGLFYHLWMWFENQVLMKEKKHPKFYVSSLQSKQHVPPESLETYLVLMYENLHYLLIDLEKYKHKEKSQFLLSGFEDPSALSLQL